ncbi:MAG: PIG-L family deacetylase, partial [Deltaproteobacteria bacterium]|nr:PIG-L family deacetylase [Deltaproteobacteria bacterium]
MRAWPVIAALVGLHCGDNLLPDGLPLGRAADLTIVAHQDDDLLFFQPDLYDVARRGSLTNVYITAGDGNHGLDQAEERIQGLLVAYARIVGDLDWNCGYIELRGHVAQHCRIPGKNISLLFLAYPDGGREGQFANGLLRLWNGEIARATTVAKRTTTYTREELIDTLAEVIDVTRPHVVRIPEVAGTHDRDHVDHMMVGALALIATARSQQQPELISYRGYATTLEPPNLIDPLFLRSRDPLAHYEACTIDCGSCGEACTDLPPEHLAWLHRRYAVAMRRAAAGALRAGDGSGCLDAD